MEGFSTGPLVLFAQSRAGETGLLQVVRLNSEYFQGSRFCNSNENMRTRRTFPITDQGETSLESKVIHTFYRSLCHRFL